MVNVENKDKKVRYNCLTTDLVGGFPPLIDKHGGTINNGSIMKVRDDVTKEFTDFFQMTDGEWIKI